MRLNRLNHAEKARAAAVDEKVSGHFKFNEGWFIMNIKIGQTVV